MTRCLYYVKCRLRSAVLILYTQNYHPSAYTTVIFRQHFLEDYSHRSRVNARPKKNDWMNSCRFITAGWAKLKVIFGNKAVTIFVKQNVVAFARNCAFGRGSGLRFLPQPACKTKWFNCDKLSCHTWQAHFNLRRRTLSHNVRRFGPTCIDYVNSVRGEWPMFASSDENKNARKCQTRPRSCIVNT